MEVARFELRQRFGYADFRAGQVDVVASVLSGRDTLGVLPTGGGKSLCYQVPALVLPGLTVVISPLISLMKDQVDRLARQGVSATFLNSTLSPGEISRRLRRTMSGELKLLYVAPERFEAGDLLHVLHRSRLSLLAVDEAHCISEWGHDFRPSFRRIAAVTQKLGNPQIVALTATATPIVRGDIARQLAMRRPRIIVRGFDRGNLSYTVRLCRTDDAKDRALLDEMGTHARPAIVYASTRAVVERIAKRLTGAGTRAVAYHGGLDNDLRHEVQEAFMRGDADTIVATNAFGMGIDKPNVRLVVHYAMPGTLEAYYQEAGRAGRDGLPAHCVLLHAFRDRFTHEWFVRGMYPERATVERVYSELRMLDKGGRVPDDGALIARRVKMETRDVVSALRLLEREHVVTREGGESSLVEVRLLATPARIHREIVPLRDASDLSLLRALWRQGGDTFYQGMLVNLERLSTRMSIWTARSALNRLRDRQMIDYSRPDAGIYLTRPQDALESFGIDWDVLARRRQSDLGKLETMQRYVYVKNCRRAFVLRYFGERGASNQCTGCDNCLPRLRR
jgi:ATP-dependent DNA helicase RecQ